MKLVTFAHNNGTQRLGAIVGEQVVDLALLSKAHGTQSPLPSTMLDFIDQAPNSQHVAQELLAHYAGAYPAGTAHYVNNVKLLAPIPRPRKNIFGIGLNYAPHVAESSRTLDTSADLPKEPVIFSKPPTSVVGPNDSIEHNANVTQQLDWEIEIAVIIGKSARHVSKEDALSHVFGYMSVIDVSARDCRRAGQWIVSKGQDTFCPCGSEIITADEIPDPQTLDLWLKLNGEMMQSDNSKNMLFDVKTLIADISSVMTLEAGDIIATGTPAGVGAGMEPQKWMWPGDVIEAGVQGFTPMRHTVINATK